jgi:hypothetical protein
VKCVYKYPVKWIVKIEGVQSFTHNGWHFDFLQEDGCITYVTITIPLTAADNLPTLTPNPKDSNAIDLQLNQPASAALLIKVLRTLEGFLSIYGLEKIMLDEADIHWIAETEEEKFREQHFQFKFTKREKSNLMAPFAVVKRSVMASTEALNLEVPLTFYRKGANDFQKRKYIDAIHDFYFLLETLFGNGKTKNYQVAEELKKSQSLISFVTQVLKEAEQSILRRNTRTTILDEFRNKFSNMTPEKYLEQIVNLRGFLHHHSLEHKKIWNPALEHEYELDAILLSHLCFKVCSTKVEALICTPLKQT